MKIAIPSNEGKFLSPHFGRTLGFAIFEIKDGKIIHEEFRENTFTGHAMGHHHEHHGEDHHGGGGQHSHHGILSALSDCEVIIAGGMGRRLQEDLLGAGKKIYITSQSEVRKAVELFLDNQLTSDKEACCHHD